MEGNFLSQSCRFFRYISEIFGNSITQSMATDGPDYAEFVYNNMKMRVYISTDRAKRESFEIEVSDGQSDFTPIWMLCAYFDCQKYNMYYDTENALENLKRAKRYIDEGKLFFVYSDAKKRERKLKIGDTVKELPYLICADRKQEMKIIFGDEWQKIFDNQPIYNKSI